MWNDTRFSITLAAFTALTIQACAPAAADADAQAPGDARPQQEPQRGPLPIDDLGPAGAGEGATDGDGDAGGARPDAGGAIDGGQALDAGSAVGAVDAGSAPTPPTPPEVSPDAGAPPVVTDDEFTHRVDAFIFREVNTCAVGNPCGGGACVGLRNGAGDLVTAFADDESFRALSPSAPAAAGGACMRLTIDDAEAARLRAELEAFVDDVATYTEGALRLQLVVYEIPTIDAALSRFGDGLWMGPWDLGALYSLTTDTDFTIVTHGVRDPDTGLHHGVAGCGGTHGADWGTAGAGHTWVPSTGDALPYECADRGVYLHEWLHQVDFALKQLSGFDDAYDGDYPACGVEELDSRAWFPDTHDCLVDPDFAQCGVSDCGGNDAVNAHVLAKHWPTGTTLVANRCRDGVQNYDETEVDVGGLCP